MDDLLCFVIGLCVGMLVSWDGSKNDPPEFRV